MDGLQMHMWLHMDTVIVHYVCSADGNADVQWHCWFLLLFTMDASTDGPVVAHRHC